MFKRFEVKYGAGYEIISAYDEEEAIALWRELNASRIRKEYNRTRQKFDTIHNPEMVGFKVKEVPA